jgi:hypothetical protein
MLPYSDDGGVDDPGCIWNRWANLAAEAGRASGQTFYAFDKMKRLVEDAGYVDVEERTFKWPIGQWARTPKMKDMGRFFKMAWQFGMEAWVLRPATNDLNVCVSLSCCEVITDIQTEGRGTRNRMTLLTNYLISSGQKNG